MTAPERLRRTPLYDAHVALGARMVPFSGWQMPIQYRGILEEARAVRSAAGVFDVSHMGRLDIRGTGSAAFLDQVFSSSVPRLRVGRGRYGVICNEEGGIIDDCILYRRGEQRFLLVPNAANAAAVVAWLTRWAPGRARVAIEDRTSESAMLALQGPRAAAILAALTPTALAPVRPFAAVEATIAGAAGSLARTGYTGEDGFELIVPQGTATEVWGALVQGGAVPCGLGARDVLRLEAGLLLHGNDMEASTNPYEAGLERFVDADREGYVAGEALRRTRDSGVARRLVGFQMTGRGIPRHGYAITDGSRAIGHVTSGGYSPTLDRSIGLGYVPTGYAPPGSRIEVDVRGRRVEAVVTTLPFYSRREQS